MEIIPLPAIEEDPRDELTVEFRSAPANARLFLVDGTPSGVITAEVMNWPGKAVASPRSRFADLVRREEATRTGVYIMVGPDPERVGGV